MAASTAIHPAAREIELRRTRSTTTIALEALEGMIIDGALTAGERINESVLAEQFGISRGPIREACRSLEQSGLLVNMTNRGMYVRELSCDQARELYEVRGALAGLAGSLIVERASDEELDALAGLVERMQASADRSDAGCYFRLNLQFHQGLIQAASNEALWNIYQSLIKQLHLFRRRGLFKDGNLQASNAEHREIVMALKARDGQLANAAMVKHVENGLQRMQVVEVNATN